MMIVTEEEAKTKWCCREPKDFKCGASECMAWRWVDRTHYRNTELWSKSQNKRVHSAYGDDAEWRPVSGEKTDPPPPPVGYCGLAGNPND